MPYKVEKHGSMFHVMNTDTGKMVLGGEHPTKMKAMAHARALYANVKDDASTGDTDLLNSLVTQYQGSLAALRRAVTSAQDPEVLSWVSDQVSETLEELSELQDLLDDQQEDANGGEGPDDMDDKKYVMPMGDQFIVKDWFTGATMATLDNEAAAITVHDLLVKAGEITDAEFTAEELANLGKAGKAFKNGNGEWSYPTPDAAHVRKAMDAWGRSMPGDRSRLKSYLKSRASAEGLSKEEIAGIDGYSS